MTNIRRLDVSLTKHGAHKVAALLKKYGKDEILSNLVGVEPGVNIERAQARKTLVVTGKIVPEFWEKAKQRGNETIDALVFLAVIFSHHRLIRAMQRSTHRKPFAGRIERGRDIDDKEFTNFAHIIEELGFSTKHTEQHVDYDLRKLFAISGLNNLFNELLATKLRSIGWDGKNDVIDEAISLDLQDVFSVSKDELRDWMSAGGIQSEESTEDSEFFFNADDTSSSEGFVFKPGHSAKKIGTVPVRPAQRPTTADLLHNKIQNSMVAALQKAHGKDNVGSEQGTGRGTSIDIVVRNNNVFWFYEIKTDSSVKACVRQAIPQLLEYAYWHGKADIAERLIIVGPSPTTKEAERYLGFLRNQFDLPIYYQHYDASTP